ncbi:flagellar hook-basal body complex protein, partial [Janthinobacterium sp.]|uniref:flagellar hook-basal body complex protein n=1 Tax=Janthinobacterium sp. TaxID=1871054 RepID=UPI00260CEBF2
MLDTLLIGTSGLLGYSQGLRVIGNNLANVNTPGFKSSQPQFSDLFDKGSTSGQHRGGASGSRGTGLGTLGAQVNFKAGIDQGTGNPLDVMVDGNGMFVIRRDDKLLYTRAGDFHFNAQDILVNASGDQVQALDSGGKLSNLELGTLARNPPKATSTVKISGNLSSTVATPAVDTTLTGVNIIDAAGASHVVNLIFKDEGGGNFKVTVNDV